MWPWKIYQTPFFVSLQQVGGPLCSSCSAARLVAHGYIFVDDCTAFERKVHVKVAIEQWILFGSASCVMLRRFRGCHTIEGSFLQYFSNELMSFLSDGLTNFPPLLCLEFEHFCDKRQKKRRYHCILERLYSHAAMTFVRSLLELLW